MKKTVFAYQVFGMIAMFPIIVFLEMNHGAGKATENNSPPVEITRAEKPHLLLHDKINDKAINEEASVTFESLLLKSILN